MGASHEAGRVGGHRPDTSFKKFSECLGLLDAREIELENHIGRVIKRLVDAVPRDARFGSPRGEAVECCLPRWEIGYSVFDGSVGTIAPRKRR